MFEELRRLANNVKTLNADFLLHQIFLDENFQRFILDLNRREQLFLKGINSLGVSLGEYSLTTEGLSEGQTFTFQGESKSKLAGDSIILFDTGEFYNSFTLKILSDGIEFDADPIKEGGDDLFQIYGVDILGLTESNTQFLIDALREKLVPVVLEAIQA